MFQKKIWLSVQRLFNRTIMALPSIDVYLKRIWVSHALERC
jgi:hypothetical protein